MAIRVVATAALLSLVTATAIADQRAGTRARRFVPASELGTRYPGVQFTGDVRVEEGVRISSGATIASRDGRILLLGGTSVGPKTKIVQSGGAPLILLDTNLGDQGIVQGWGSIVRSSASGTSILAGGRLVKSVNTGLLANYSGTATASRIKGLVRGRVDATGSTIGGIAAGPLRLSNADIGGIAIGAPGGAPYHLNGAIVPHMTVSSNLPLTPERGGGASGPWREVSVVKFGDFAQGFARDGANMKTLNMELQSGMTIAAALAAFR